MGLPPSNYLKLEYFFLLKPMGLGIPHSKKSPFKEIQINIYIYIYIYSIYTHYVY